MRYDEIVRYCAEIWQVTSTCTVGKYIAKAKKILAETTAATIEEKRSEALARYLELYKLAVKRNSFAECRNILTRIDKICGLESISLTGADGGPIKIQDMNDEDMAKRMVEIEKILGVKIQE
jgi:hypothetical protein